MPAWTWAARFRDIRARPIPQLGTASGTAETSPAVLLPAGQGALCSPWTAFEQSLHLALERGHLVAQEASAPGARTQRYQGTGACCRRGRHFPRPGIEAAGI